MHAQHAPCPPRRAGARPSDRRASDSTDSRRRSAPPSPPARRERGSTPPPAAPAAAAAPRTSPSAPTPPGADVMIGGGGVGRAGCGFGGGNSFFTSGGGSSTRRTISSVAISRTSGRDASSSPPTAGRHGRRVSPRSACPDGQARPAGQTDRSNTKSRNRQTSSQLQKPCSLALCKSHILAELSLPAPATNCRLRRHAAERHRRRHR